MQYGYHVSAFEAPQKASARAHRRSRSLTMLQLAYGPSHIQQAFGSSNDLHRLLQDTLETNESQELQEEATAAAAVGGAAVAVAATAQEGQEAQPRPKPRLPPKSPRRPSSSQARADAPSHQGTSERGRNSSQNPSRNTPSSSPQISQGVFERGQNLTRNLPQDLPHNMRQKSPPGSQPEAGSCSSALMRRQRAKAAVLESAERSQQPASASAAADLGSAGGGGDGAADWDCAAGEEQLLLQQQGEVGEEPLLQLKLPLKLQERLQQAAQGRELREGDPDAPDIPTPRSYAEAITGPYSSQWQTAMDTEMDSWKSTGTYVDEVPPPGANISTITLTQSHMVQQVLQRFGFTYSSPQSTPLPTGHSLSAPPSDESVEPSGPYSELVGCLMYLMTCTRPDLAYPLSILAHYVALGRHRKEHMDAAKRVLRLCSTLGMGLMLGGRARVVLTGHADASWKLRWLTYLLTDLGEAPRSPPVLCVDNKAMIALCQEHR
ncbi:unnamed protein product [Closterium sp. NIES-54]